MTYQPNPGSGRPPTPVYAWTPYGRRRTVAILAAYMARDHAAGLLDAWYLYLNTDPDQVDDLAYAYDLAAQYAWVELLERPAGVPRHPGPKQRNTGYAYRHFTDPYAVYVRFDDDIVYVHPDALRNLVAARLAERDAAAVFPIIVNNAPSTWWLVQCGLVPREWGEVSDYCMDETGWADGRYAVRLHSRLLDAIEHPDTRTGFVDRVASEFFAYQDRELKIGRQFSVSCFASTGDMYAHLPDGPGVLVPDEEEHWHTVHRPTATGHPNRQVGNAVVAHYTFSPQREIVDASNVLERYRAAASRVAQATTSPPPAKDIP